MRTAATLEEARISEPVFKSLELLLRDRHSEPESAGEKHLTNLSSEFVRDDVVFTMQSIERTFNSRKKEKKTTRTRFELMRDKPMGTQIPRLNHSAIVPTLPRRFRWYLSKIPKSRSCSWPSLAPVAAPHYPNPTANNP